MEKFNVLFKYLKNYQTTHFLYMELELVGLALSRRRPHFQFPYLQANRGYNHPDP